MAHRQWQSLATGTVSAGPKGPGWVTAPSAADNTAQALLTKATGMEAVREGGVGIAEHQEDALLQLRAWLQGIRAESAVPSHPEESRLHVKPAAVRSFLS